MGKVTLQGKINNIQPYFRSVEIKESFYILRVVYPNKWSGYNRDDEKIKTAKSDNSNENEWFYYADIESVDLNEIFDLIEETIVTNQEMYQKIELMKIKMSELKDIFQEESLEKLKTLQFTFDSTANKPKKRQYNKKKKDTTTEETSEVQSTEPVQVEEDTEKDDTTFNINQLENIEEEWT